VTERDDWSQGMTSRIVDEVEYIRKAFSERGENGDQGIDIGVVRDGRGLGYMHAPGQLLVLEQYFGGVLDSLRRQVVPFYPFDPLKDDEGRQDGEPSRPEPIPAYPSWAAPRLHLRRDRARRARRD
jgi:hypothetical protein